MDTILISERTTCETCKTEMLKNEAEIKDLDINNLSLLAMFNIQKFYIVKCPACQKSAFDLR
ncbi:MAG: hypothetical protein WKF89_06525 [Chitinophagaceae bacterium]